jgi:hypothetical protein
MCSQFLSVDQFGSNRGTKTGLSHRCKKCNVISVIATTPEQKEALRERRRRHERKRRLRPEYVARHRELGRLRSQRKGPEIRLKAWKRNILTKYGLSHEEYLRILDDQGGRCAICKTDQFRDSRPVVDHCHKTGNVRGLLCHKCNAGIGMFGEEISYVACALQYLEKSK